jgi:hypothetical protein
MQNIFSLKYVFLSLFFFVSCSPTAQETYNFPTTISGQVKDTQGTAIPAAKVSLSTDTTLEAVVTDVNGFFYLKGFSSGKHRIKIEKVGFELFEADVPSAINGVSTINPILPRKMYSVPTIKPLSTGKVRINRNILETDFDGDGIYEPFVVKGAAFSPVPIGSTPTPQAIYDRSIYALVDMHANTVRTYSGVDKYFLQKAAQNNIRVMVGFWVNLDLDLSLPDIRKTVIDDFANLVFDLKDYPAILMWNIGNEQNYSSTPNNGNSQYWYSLVQEMAVAAYKVEGEKFHPVCAGNGGYANIGSVAKGADDASMSYVDLWASNAYEWNFGIFFTEYKKKSTKPIVISEFGIDALDNRTKTEYELTQAEFDSTNWNHIRTAGEVCVGGTVFEFTDEWWKDDKGNRTTHDYGGYSTGAHPDGYSNEEWWGVIAVTPDTDGDGLDEWRARKAYYMFQRNWK